MRGLRIDGGPGFDTDGSGTVDAGDDYWNGGVGWEPLGGNIPMSENVDIPYGGIFDGNGNTIHNLFINRPGYREVGLFGAIAYLGRGHSDAIIRT